MTSLELFIRRGRTMRPGRPPRRHRDESDDIWGRSETLPMFIERMPRELLDDVVGFNWLVSVGRTRYQLDDDRMRAFLKRCVLALMRKGGKPLEDGDDGIHGWKIATRYGSQPEEIAEAMVAEWEAAGRPMPEWGQWAFGRSHVYNRKIGEI